MAVAAVPAADPPRTEQTRARYTDLSGDVERAGGRVHWEAYGAGDPPIVFVPPWQVVHSRAWKFQVPSFARRHRVVAWDNRGNGRSDRPRDPMVHVTRERTANLLAVMDAAGVDSAILLGVSSSSGPMTVLGAEHPERVRGLVYICPASPFGEPSYKGRSPFDEPLPDEEGWNRENIHAWRRDFRGYLEFFFGEAFPEPHSTKQIEDGVGWGLETDVETLAATVRTPPTFDAPAFAALCGAIRAPALVIQGTDERISHSSQAFGLAAAIPGARLELVEGGGHLVHAREPVRVNLLIRDFIRHLGARAVTTVRPIAPDAYGSESGRARLPDRTAFATSPDGTRLAFDLYGVGEPTILFLPSTPIIHARQWKAQVPYLSRHFRVVAFDGRGNGRSDRPLVPEAYTDDRLVEDIVAVLDASETPRALVVGLCGDGVWRSILLAGRQPERVAGIVAFAAGVPLLSPPHPWRVQYSFQDELPTDEGWAKLNRHYWQRDYPGFVRFFFEQVACEPHSTKVVDDVVRWAAEDGSMETMLADMDAPADRDLDTVLAAVRAVRCPMLLVHGTADRCQPPSRSRALGELTGARLVEVEGGDHLVPARHPVLANLLIRDFAREIGGFR